MDTNRAITCLFALLVLLSPLHADLENGRKAAAKGDFKTAIREWRPLAEKGDPWAQYELGRLYARGEGVKQDFERARVLFQQAARGGSHEACEKISIMYRRGDGVPKDPKQAALWHTAYLIGPDKMPQLFVSDKKRIAAPKNKKAPAAGNCRCDAVEKGAIQNPPQCAPAASQAGMPAGASSNQVLPSDLAIAERVRSWCRLLISSETEERNQEGGPL